MRNNVSLEDAHAVSLSNFQRYLVASGWRQRRLKIGYSAQDTELDLFVRSLPGETTLQLPLPHSPLASDYLLRLRDALQTLIDAEQRPIGVLTDEIQSIGYDILRTAVPTTSSKT